MNDIQKIIQQTCIEKGIDFKLVSKDWITILKKGNKIKYIVGYKFPLNDQAVSKICDDKYALYEVMKQFDIPMAEHYIVFNKYNKEEIIEYARKYNYNMVIQNNVGTCGRDMYHVDNEQELFLRINELLNKDHAINISPYYKIKTEYRVIMLKNKVELVYGKKKPVVTGDGCKSIYELLCEFNKNYFEKIECTENLKRVLSKNEQYEYNWQFNLSKGSMPFFVEDKNKLKKLKEMAKDISSKLGVNFASVDLIEVEDGSIMLLEVNSGVMMKNFCNIFENGKLITKRICSKVLDEMFR